MGAPGTPAALVSEFVSLLAAKRIDEACALVSPDCVYDNVPIGPVRGPEGIAATLEGFFALCDELDWIIERQVSEGDLASATVLNERLDRFKIAGAWHDLPVAGVFVVTDGRISLWRDFFDKETLFGAMSAARPA